MTPNPITVRPNTPIAKVKELFAVKRIWAIYVVNTKGKAVGVITQQDYSNRISFHVKIASEMMSTPVYTIDADDDAPRVLDLLNQHKIGSVAVTEKDRLCGIITRNDFTNRYAQPTEHKICDYCKSSVSYLSFSTCPQCNMLLCGYHKAAESHHCKGIDWDSLKKKEYEQSQVRWENYKRDLALKRSLNAIAKLTVILIVLAIIAITFFPNYVGLLGFNKCSDNTSSGWCSANKPYFCNEGVLVYDANKCGCSGNQIAVNNLCKTPMNCTDGTPHGACSLSKPMLCYDGALTEKASKCGCPQNQLGEGEQCKDLEQMVHVLINEQRQSYGLSPLSFDSNLAHVARGHSEDMGQRNFFDHINPDGLDPTARGQLEGYSCYKDYGSYYSTGIAENIFEMHTYSEIWYTNGIETSRDYYSATQIANEVVTGWMNSPGHRQNILTATYDREGIGVAITTDGRIYVTENFC